MEREEREKEGGEEGGQKNCFAGTVYSGTPNSGRNIYPALVTRKALRVAA